VNDTQASLELGSPEPAARIYVAGGSLAYVWPAQTGFLWYAVVNIDSGEVFETRRPVANDWLNFALNVVGFDMGRVCGHHELSRPEWRKEAYVMGFGNSTLG
jgi:hypothetical protein